MYISYLAVGVYQLTDAGREVNGRGGGGGIYLCLCSVYMHNRYNLLCISDYVMVGF